MRKAFTLAEVLITLGVIGIVAAMTLPQLLKNYQAKVLETAFKKSYSNISKAYLATITDLGLSNIRVEFASYNGTEYPRAKEFENTFYKNIGKTKKITNYYTYKNYNNSNSRLMSPIGCGTGCPKPLYLLADGSSVGMFINSNNIYFYIDTTGPRGPNRYGFDIFAFYVAFNDKLSPVRSVQIPDGVTDGDIIVLHYPPCSLKNNEMFNGFGCAYHALTDSSPEDKSKSYWKNLPK